MSPLTATLFRRAGLLVGALALSALGACGTDAVRDPLAPTVSARSADVRAEGVSAHAVPFKGTVEATETHTQSADGTNVAIHITGTGTATQLGRFTLVDDLSASLITLEGTSTMVLTAANGDRITATATVQATPSTDRPALTVVETATITGGTGRFAGATGSFTLTRLLDVRGEPYPSTGSITAGSITLAH